jgi:hypothetical protein
MDQDIINAIRVIPDLDLLPMGDIALQCMNAAGVFHFMTLHR